MATAALEVTDEWLEDLARRNAEELVRRKAAATDPTTTDHRWSKQIFMHVLLPGPDGRQRRDQIRVALRKGELQRYHLDDLDRVGTPQADDDATTEAIRGWIREAATAQREGHLLLAYEYLGAAKQEITMDDDTMRWFCDQLRGYRNQPGGGFEDAMGLFRYIHSSWAYDAEQRPQEQGRLTYRPKELLLEAEARSEWRARHKRTTSNYASRKTARSGLTKDTDRALRRLDKKDRIVDLAGKHHRPFVIDGCLNVERFHSHALFDAIAANEDIYLEGVGIYLADYAKQIQEALDKGHEPVITPTYTDVQALVAQRAAREALERKIRASGSTSRVICRHLLDDYNEAAHRHASVEAGAFTPEVVAAALVAKERLLREYGAISEGAQLGVDFTIDLESDRIPAAMRMMERLADRGRLEVRGRAIYIINEDPQAVRKDYRRFLAFHGEHWACEILDAAGIAELAHETRAGGHDPNVVTTQPLHMRRTIDRKREVLRADDIDTVCLHDLLHDEAAGWAAFARLYGLNPRSWRELEQLEESRAPGLRTEDLRLLLWDRLVSGAMHTIFAGPQTELLRHWDALHLTSLAKSRQAASRQQSPPQARVDLDKPARTPMSDVAFVAELSLAMGDWPLHRRVAAACRLLDRASQPRALNQWQIGMVEELRFWLEELHTHSRREPHDHTALHETPVPGVHMRGRFPARNQDFPQDINDRWRRERGTALRASQLRGIPRPG